MALIPIPFDDIRHFPTAQDARLLQAQQEYARRLYEQQQNALRRSWSSHDQANASRYFYDACTEKPRQVEIQSMMGLTVIQPAPVEPKSHSPKIETKRWGLMPRFARRPKAVAI